MPKAKRRTKQNQTAASSSSALRKCSFTTLPLELIAMIALYTQSPRDILALTRTNKFFCRTFLLESNQYIWRYARQNCLPEPLPNPCSRFTEASFAAFVFSSGYCESCGKPVEFFSSFGIRLRLCQGTRCREILKNHSTGLQLSSNGDVYKIFEDTLPYVESPDCISGAGIGSWPASRKFRRSGWLYALQEHLEVSTQPDAFAKYTKDCIKRSVQNREFMEMCIALHSWKINYLAALSAVNAINLTFSGQLANQEGLSLSDLMNTPTYGPFFKRKTKALEHIKRSHYDLLESAITADLVRVKERRARRSSGNRYTATRKIIDMHYDKLRALKLESPLPCLPSFRKLPTPDQLQRSSLPEEEIKKTLQTEPITQLVHSDLANFHLNAKNTLGKVLGFPDWISASNKKLHPVDRLTARFRCRRCQRVEAKYKYFGCLDYAGVIMHMCATTMDKPVPPKPFRATMFEKDTKAIQTLLSLLKACGIREDEKGSDELLSAVGPRVVCLSCDAQIILDSMAVIGHSHRHQTMSLALLPQDEAKKILGDHALLPGLVSRLTSPGKIATMNRNMKAYLCRHCKQAKPKNSAAGNTSSSSGTTTSEGSAILPTDGTFLRVTTTTTTTVNMTPSAISKQMYTFDALRCHLQDKHQVYSVRDEDVICTQELHWPKNKY